MIIVLKQNADNIWEMFQPYHEQIVPFRDASYGDCHYECTVNYLFLLIPRFFIVGKV